ncbi:hypothetical protein [Vreelandella venusta]|uniref:hypothetical protein n=1 Tax=Halomonadaceae TaxID=28256 RepID=UPI000B5B32D5|nr:MULTISPECIES: hypothetical protein [Halomonas]ASK21946.1 hypothetical protein CEK60_18710 [Halomonas sp. N3-2A]QPI63984.1 hypothetical protein IR195_19485 [Halomonas venusta]
MKITEKVEIDTVTDVMCDVCLCSTRGANDGLEFATLQAHWGYGARHDGERYELHLCESCFFGTVTYLKQERRIPNLFNDEVGKEAGEQNDTFGLVATDDYFRDDGGSKL